MKNDHNNQTHGEIANGIIRLRIVSPACQSDEKSKYCKHPTVGCVFYLVILVKNSVRLMKNNTQCPIYVDKQAHSETS